jgi:MFS superfamily sulfate permease-like transporter
LVVRIRENLSFANTGQLKERLRRVSTFLELKECANQQLERYGMQKSHPSDEPRRDSAKALILHMGDVEEIDASQVHLQACVLTYSAVSILQELTKAYTESGVGVHFAHLRPAHMSLFELVGITEQASP